MQSQKANGVQWITMAVGIILLLGVLFVLPSSIDKVVRDNVPDINVPSTNDIANAVIAQMPTFPDEVDVNLEEFDSLCENTDGCGNSWDYNDRSGAETRALLELEEDSNRDLFRGIEDLVDIDDKDDISVVTVDQLGDVKTNLDNDRGDSDNREVTVEMVLEVEYFEDGDNSDTKTKYFRVVITLDDMEDGIVESDAVINSIEKVSSRFTLP